MSIIGEMYENNIKLSERTIKKGSEYEKINSELINSIEKFIPLLNTEERELYEDIQRKTYALSYIMEKENFIEGFRIGAQMVSEIDNYESANFISNMSSEVINKIKEAL